MQVNVSAAVADMMVEEPWPINIFYLLNLNTLWKTGYVKNFVLSSVLDRCDVIEYLMTLCLVFAGIGGNGLEIRDDV